MFEKAGRLEEEIHHKKAQIAELKGVHAKQEEQLKSFVELLVWVISIEVIGKKLLVLKNCLIVINVVIVVQNGRGGGNFQP